MSIYPFLIRGPTGGSRIRKVKVEGRNFKNALIKALSVYPAKFVNFKFARNMDLHNVKQIVINLSKANKGVEHTVWLNEKEGEFYVSFLNAKGFTVLVEDETNLAGIEIGSARLNKFRLESVWVNGVEIEKPEKIETPIKQKSKKVAKATKTMKPESKKVVKTTKKTDRKLVTGKKVKLSIKEIRKAHAAGKTIRNLKGTKYTPGYIKTFKDADREVECLIEG